MRKNLFLHFLNRDSREIYGLYKFHLDENHRKILRRAMNAAVILCEDFCYLPPGFIVEDDIAFDLAESQVHYLQSGIFQFPIREGNLSDYAEKKRAEYHPLRNRYSGLFDDNRIDFLGRNAQGLVRRKTHISDRIVSGWREGAERKIRIWDPIKQILTPADISKTALVPENLASDGTAVTWSAILPKLPPAVRPAFGALRNALQHVYFQLYCREFGLITLSSIPQMVDAFDLPHQRRSYAFDRLLRFLESFYLSAILLDGTASFIVNLKNKVGFISFIDAYIGLSERCSTLSEISFHSSIMEKSTRYVWRDLPKRFKPVVVEPREFDIYEIDDAFREAADVITARWGLESRTTIVREKQSPSLTTEIWSRKMPDVVLFVALQEELDVLTKALALTRNHIGPAASGSIGGIEIDVLCPKSMGRVAAAVEVAAYLEKRKLKRPKLLLIVGLAGGFRQMGTERGHIICTNKVYDLANRKIFEDDAGNSVTKFRRQDYDMSDALRDVLLSDKFDKNSWVSYTLEKVAGWPIDRRPSIHEGNMASVDEVVANNDWGNQLIAHTDKLRGVEMEAGGVCAAAKKFKVDVSMLRAVSDNADPAKIDDQWRSIGMQTLATLIERLPFSLILQKIS